ncbi:uncharacterized protein LOC132271766 isoform X2 [Cornus florida]|uniref:uncharacterized protein LOC132271766 isoform X2 n=1 Tax=Cornus florida TaxID=4283 RepID=UPI002898D516|nr:uncharacterized protein LOC132271766 isoform X2 [Cornus florida]
MQKMVLKLKLDDDKAKQEAMKQEAMKRVSGLTGVDSIVMEITDKKVTVTVIGNIEPRTIFRKLSDICPTMTFTVEPAKEPEKKKEDARKEDKKKEDARKDDKKKMVLKLKLDDDKAKQEAMKQEAMKRVSGLTGCAGVDSIVMEITDKKVTVTVIGNIEPRTIFGKLSDICPTMTFTVEPAKEPEKKKEDARKDDKKKEDKKKEDARKEDKKKEDARKDDKKKEDKKKEDARKEDARKDDKKKEDKKKEDARKDDKKKEDKKKEDARKEDKKK